MKKLIVGLLALAFVAADDAKDKAVKAELGKLEGTWQVVAFEHQGMKLDRTAAKETLVIKGGKIVHRTKISDTNVSDSVLADSFTIDPTKKPKEMDCVVKKFDEKHLDVDELNGDELKLAHFIPTDLTKPEIPPGRPTNFDTTKNKSTQVWIVKRIKE